MVAADKAKKPKIPETPEEGSELTPEFLLSIQKMQDVQEELEKINEEASDKALEVEKKYNDVRKPVYDKRTEVIKKIPDFWPTAFLSHPVLSSLLTEQDHKIFEHFTSLEVEDFKDGKWSYSISFTFNPNPYFEDSKLTKSFTCLDDGTTKVTATTIKWKEGMDVSNGTGNEKKGKKRCHDSCKDDCSNGSFFSWFTGNEQKDETEILHDEVAEIIREDLWANPLEYYQSDDDDEEFGDDEEEIEIGTDDSEED